MLYWNSFLSGNREAFSKIYQNIIHDLYSFGITLTTDSELVKDCIQDVFIRLYQNKARLTSIKNIKVYLLTALKNALINEFKKKHVFHKFKETYSAAEQGETLEESEEERLITKESEETAQITIGRLKSVLTARQWEILHYRFVEELSIEEIASLLNVNYQSVSNSIQRSLKKMRNFYLKNRV